jgi:hypothetical protein
MRSAISETFFEADEADACASDLKGPSFVISFFCASFTLA